MIQDRQALALGKQIGARVPIQGKYIQGCIYYILDYVEVDYDYYELVSLDSFYKDLKDRVEKDVISIEINKQALWEVNSLKENLGI